jgi:hypothetical protein
MAEKLLLHLQYECTRHKIQLPWDAVAHRLHPGSSGAAVMQHLNRLRRELITEGHLVPPLPSRPSFCETSDMEVRGFIRDLNAEERHATRPVRFDEHVEDRKFNLPDALDHGEEYTSMNTSFGHGGPDATDDEMDPPLPESPTPLGRAQRAMARREGRPTVSRDVNGQYEHNGCNGSTQDANPITPTDEVGSHNIGAFHPNLLYVQTPDYHRRDSATGSDAAGQQHAPQVYPHAAPPLHPMAYHGAYSFSDAPDGFVTPAAIENGGASVKSPYEYFPYPYPIWQMGYPMPFPHPHAHTHAHSHAHATLHHAPSPKAPHADPVLSFESSSTAEFVIKDEFHAAEASTSGSDTQPNDDAQLQDLIVSALCIFDQGSMHGSNEMSRMRMGWVCM